MRPTHPSLTNASTPPQRTVVTIPRHPTLDAPDDVESAITAGTDRGERLVQTCITAEHTTLIFAPANISPQPQSHPTS